MIYKVRQTENKKRLLFGTKEVIKEYSFNNYKEALIFALNEQIKLIYVEIGEGITTLRKPFKIFHTLEQFKKLALKNPLFYVGVHNAQKINLDTYYFYLVNNHLNKLKKLY